MGTTVWTREQGNLERRMRRLADQQGRMLVKGRRFADRGLYVLVSDSAGNRIGRRGGQAALSEFTNGFGMTLAAVEAELTGT